MNETYRSHEPHQDLTPLEPLEYSEAENSLELLRARELSKLRELSHMIRELQTSLRQTRSTLAQRYQPEVEAQGQREMIERDEALISWGQCLLGLQEIGATLRLTWPQGEEFILWDEADSAESQQETQQESQQETQQETQELDRDQEDGRVLGSALARSQVLISEQKREASTNLSPLTKSADESEAQIRTQGQESQLESPAEISADHQAQAKSQDGSQDDPQDRAQAEGTDPLNQIFEDLRPNMCVPNWGQKEQQTEPSAEPLPQERNRLAIEIAQRVGPPREIKQLKEHLLELEEEVECCQRWSVFTQAVQHAVVTLITSRLRRIQSKIEENAFDQERIAKMFRRLTRFSSDFRPGFVHGLSRDKMPEYDNWRIDEVYAWRRLERLLNLKPHLPPLSSDLAQKVEAIKELIAQHQESDHFENELRRLVTDCLSSGLPAESPHLARILPDHLSILSGKRFKKLRLAVSSPLL